MADLTLALTALMLLLTGCGKEDSLFSGFSLVVVIIIGFVVIRHFAKKSSS